VTGATGYKVYYGVSSQTLVGSPSTTSFTGTYSTNNDHYFSVSAVNSAGEESAQSDSVRVQPPMGSYGSSLTITVTGYRGYTDKSISIHVLGSNPATLADFQTAIDDDSSLYARVAAIFAANPPNNNVYTLGSFEVTGYAPPDSTYTVVVVMGSNLNLATTEVYKFTNVTISGGSGTVPFNDVVGSSVGTNGRLK
jgi:hypothetical protein